MTGFRSTIKRKLLALVGGTLVALLAFWAWSEVREQTSEAEAELALASQQAAGHLAAMFREVTEHLAAFARIAAVRSRQVERMQEELFREVAAVHPEVENVFAVAADGLTVASAHGGEEALIQAQALRPQADLIDLNMPGLSGLEAIPGLRRALPDTGIIAVTLLDTGGYRQAALAAGADDFVPKMTLNADLLPAIRRLALANRTGSGA